MENLILRRAKLEDIARIIEIIIQAQRQMANNGSDQWQNGYPSEKDILNDINQENGYILESHNLNIIGYAAIIFTGEPAYNTISDGNWLINNHKYVVVHRLAVADEVKGNGIAIHFMTKIEELAKAKGFNDFRVDTNFDNFAMLKSLDRLGFTKCGKIIYESGERLAFEKLL